MPRRFNSWKKSSRRSNTRQPQDWHKKTGERSGTKILKGSAQFQITENSPLDQVHRLKKSMEKVAKQIKKDIQKKNLSTTPPEEKAFLEARILKKNSIYYWKQVRLEILKKQKVEPQDKRVVSEIKNKQESERIHKEKVAKYRERLQKNPELQEKMRVATSKVPFREPIRRELIVKGPRDKIGNVKKVKGYKTFSKK